MYNGVWRESRAPEDANALSNGATIGVASRWNEMKGRPAAILAIVGMCFCLGLTTVLLGERTTASSVPSVLRIFPDGGISRWLNPERSQETSILVLGIDRLDRPDPALRAIWLVTVVEPDGAITISGVPSDLDLVPGAEVRLNSFFAWTPEGGVAPPFLEALERALRVQVDVVVVLDDFAFARLVDYVGGLPIEGEIGLPVEDQVLSGEQVLALQSVFEGDPLGQTRLQGSILEGLIPQVAKLGSTPDLEPILALVPDHASVSTHVAQFAVLAGRLLPLNPERVSIQLILAPVP